MQIFKNDIWGSVKMPESFSELLDYVLGTGDDVSYWRGQSNIAWKLDSSIARKAIRNNEVFTLRQNNFSSIDFWEKCMIEKAKQSLYHYDINGRQLGDIELLAKLQHMGASTRLLDFSKSILIALWFCASENQHETGLIIGIHTNIIAGQGERYFEFTDSYDVFTKRINNSEDIWLVDAPPVVSRIAAQNSVFLCSKCINSDHGTFILPEEKYITKLAISPELKKESLKMLSAHFNITPYTIYPDVEGFAKANSSEWRFSEFDRW